MVSAIFAGVLFMEINGSILSLFNPYNLSGDQRAKQQQNAPMQGESSAREVGGGMAPSYTAPSISSVMWSMQTAADTTIREETEADIKAKSRHEALVGEMHDYANMTPAEKIRKSILDQMGLDEESLKAMPPEERAAIEKQIADAIKKQLTGIDGGDRNTATADVPETASDDQTKAG
jgi:hypothetical protein